LTKNDNQQLEKQIKIKTHIITYIYQSTKKQIKNENHTIDLKKIV